MKMKVCLSVIILFYGTGFAQNPKRLFIDTVQVSCHYLYEFQQDSTSRYSVKTQEMMLQIGKHCSKFVHNAVHLSDSLLMVFEGNSDPQTVFNKVWSMTEGAGLVHSYCSNYAYKNYPNKGDLLLTANMRGKHLKSIDCTQLSWKIVPDTVQEVAGYTCKMATTTFAGRNYVAWFTLEVPISEGPYKFSGLPGLIVKICDLQQQHKYSLLSIRKSKGIEPIILYDKNYISVTPKEYVDALNLKQAQLYNQIQQEDKIKPDSDESKARALTNLKSQNNFIEKY